jgi:neutral ceramidase
VQVVALGDELAWVALPGEIFVELANGSLGYIPTKRAFEEGNYEPTSARVASGSGEMLADTAVRLLNELHAGK